MCNGATQERVFDIISEERQFQDQKWGTVQERPHEVGVWILIMEQLLQDARKAYTSADNDLGALDELRKVVAVGVACMEQHGVVSRFHSKPLGVPYEEKLPLDVGDYLVSKDREIRAMVLKIEAPLDSSNFSYMLRTNSGGTMKLSRSEIFHFFEREQNV